MRLFNSVCCGLLEIVHVIPDFIQLVDVKQHALSMVVRQVLPEVHNGFCFQRRFTGTAVKHQFRISVINATR